MPKYETTARNNSLCCVNAAPISRPALLPPSIASRRCGAVLIEEPLCRGCEIVEHVLFACQHPRAMPRLAVFAAAVLDLLGRLPKVLRQKATV
jgi:hypothetical protein